MISLGGELPSALSFPTSTSYRQQPGASLEISSLILYFPLCRTSHNFAKLAVDMQGRPSGRPCDFMF